MFALVDCNNFYASCERVFQPKLKGKPVIVLSNNDGCVIARSTAHELRGIPCIPIEEAPKPKQTIIVSRSFGQSITTLDAMLEAIVSYTTRAGEELRSQGLVAKHIQVFLTTNRFNNDPFYENTTTLQLPVASSYTPELIHYAAQGIRRIFRQGFRYKKCGLMLMELSPVNQPQFDMFDRQDRDKQLSAMSALDAVNNRWGAGTLFYAGAGIKKPWAMKRGQKSPHYTTEWADLLKIVACA